jgi:hypothetical protein
MDGVVITLLTPVRGSQIDDRASKQKEHLKEVLSI